MIKLSVNTKNNKYLILIGSGLINKLSSLLKNNSINFNKCLVVIDKNVPKKNIKIILKSLNNTKNIIHFFHATEKNKNQKSVDKILEKLELLINIFFDLKKFTKSSPLLLFSKEELFITISLHS